LNEPENLIPRGGGVRWWGALGWWGASVIFRNAANQRGDEVNVGVSWVAEIVATADSSSTASTSTRAVASGEPPGGQLDAFSVEDALHTVGHHNLVRCTVASVAR